MLIQQTLDKMNAMKMSAMAEALELQLGSSEYAELSFEERVGLLIDTEWTAREQRKLTRRLRFARMRHPASLENVDFKTVRNLNRQQILTLGSCSWIQERHNLAADPAYAQTVDDLVTKIDAWDDSRPLVPPSLVAGYEGAP